MVSDCTDQMFRSNLMEASVTRTSKMRVSPGDLFGRLDGCRVAILGDFCLDVYWEADMRLSELSRETPHFPLPIVSERLSPGGAGNVLALRPREVVCLGVVGDDWRGKALVELLGGLGAEVSGLLVDDARQTNAYIKPLRRGVSEVVYGDPRLDFANYAPLSAATEARLLSALDAVAARADVLCVSDQLTYGCVTPAVRERLAELGSAGLRIVVDSRDRIGLYRQVMVKPNELEASRALELPETADAAAPAVVAQRLENRTGRPGGITRGAQGWLVAGAGGAGAAWHGRDWLLWRGRHVFVGAGVHAGRGGVGDGRRGDRQRRVVGDHPQAADDGHGLAGRTACRMGVVFSRRFLFRLASLGGFSLVTFFSPRFARRFFLSSLSSLSSLLIASLRSAFFFRHSRHSRHSRRFFSPRFARRFFLFFFLLRFARRA